jgi:hypothetical protein
MEAKKYPDWVLGEWIWGEEESTPRKTHDAKEVLRRAIGSRTKLLAQIAHETPPKKTEEMTWSAVLKNLVASQNTQGEPELLVPRELLVGIVQPIKNDK